MNKNDFIEQTLVLIKPDAVSRKIISQIIERFERADLKIIALEMITADRKRLEGHFPIHDKNWIKNMGQTSLNEYETNGANPVDVLGSNDPEEIGRQILEWNFEYLSSGPVVAMIIEGIMAISVVRKMVGDTIPSNALPGTIRGDFSVYSASFANYMQCACKNIIHASGNLAEAKAECKNWFPLR